MARQPQFTQLHWDFSGKLEDLPSARDKMNLILQDIIEMFWTEARVTDKILTALTASGSALDHGGLSGLADDDHTQYIRVDGTRAFSGAQSMGSNKLTSLAAATVAGDAIRFEQGNKFETIATTSGTNPVADSLTDTLTLTAGANMTVTGNSATDTVTFAVVTSPAHNILSTTHGDTSGSGGEANGDLVQRRAGTWQSLAVGVAQSILVSVGSAPTWTISQYRLFEVETVTANETYTVETGVTALFVELVGGGAGGGGVSGGIGQSAGAGGGGAGGYASEWLTAIAASYVITIGAGGAGGAAGVNNGTAGGTTSFAADLTATGGTGGTAMATGTAGTIVPGGAGGLGASANINSAGGPGGKGIRLTATANGSGEGGSGPWGGGGAAVLSATGIAGRGYGAGGSGAATVGNTNRAGGAGTDGAVRIWKFYG